MNALDIIGALEHGGIAAELDTAIAEATAAARNTGKAAEVVLVMKIKPHKGSSGRLREHPMLIEGDINTKLPKLPREETILFADDSNHLTQTPTSKQQDLGLATELKGALHG